MAASGERVLQTLINIYYSSSRLPLSISAKPRNGSPIEQAANYIRAVLAGDYPPLPPTLARSVRSRLRRERREIAKSGLIEGSSID